LKGPQVVVYISCIAVAEELGLRLGFNVVPDDDGKRLVAQRNGYTLDNHQALPVQGYCDPDALACKPAAKPAPTERPDPHRPKPTPPKAAQPA
jgi:hypothetical protein